MADAIEVNIGVEHGPDCTCTRLDPIHIQPVIVSPDCPQSPREPRAKDYVVGGHGPAPVDTGRLIITWPAAGNSPALPNWGVTFHDADTGEQILTVLKLSLILGTDTGYEQGIIEADITALVDEDYNILAAGQPVATDAYREHCDCIKRHRLNGSLTDEETDRLDALDRKFPGPQFRTGVFRYVVAEMRVAEAKDATAQ